MPLQHQINFINPALVKLIMKARITGLNLKQQAMREELCQRTMHLAETIIHALL